MTTKQQYLELTQLRRDNGSVGRQLRCIYRECLDGALHRLDKTYRAFFRRLGAGCSPGFPRYKNPSRWTQIEFCHGNRALLFDAEQRYLRIPGVGRMRVRKGRTIPPFGRAWLVLRTGRWYACFECERTASEKRPDAVIVGIDRGVRVLAATSCGEKVPNPRFSAKNAAVSLPARTITSLTVWGADGKAVNRADRERQKAVLRLRRALEREKNARRDYLHKAARRLVDRYSVIAMERLRVRFMTRSARGSAARPGRNVRAKSGLNRAILDAGFTLFRSMIIAKAEEAGCVVLEVDPKYTSQTCPVCGARNAANRKKEHFLCITCGHDDDADVNAAKVILARAQSALRSEPYPDEESGNTRSVV